jgi:hypothetical protein
MNALDRLILRTPRRNAPALKRRGKKAWPSQSNRMPVELKGIGRKCLLNRRVQGLFACSSSPSFSLWGGEGGGEQRAAYQVSQCTHDMHVANTYRGCMVCAE